MGNISKKRRSFTGSSQLRVYRGSACRWRRRGRGLLMMGVLMLPTGETSTCLTLPSLALI